MSDLAHYLLTVNCVHPNVRVHSYLMCKVGEEGAVLKRVLNHMLDHAEEVGRPPGIALVTRLSESIAPVRNFICEMDD